MTIKGEPGHSSQPTLAKNAIWGLHEALNRLKALAAAMACPALLNAEDKPLRDVIDGEISAAWQREKVAPAAPAPAAPTAP